MDSKKIKNKNFIFIWLFAVILVVLSVTTIVATVNRPSDNAGIKEGFVKNTSYYNSNQAHIDAYSLPVNSTDIPMTTARNMTSFPDDSVITISSARELYYFSAACNGANKDVFLSSGRHYKLLCNIDYRDETEYDFIPIAYDKDDVFAGTFDGQGYDISNLLFVMISDTASSIPTDDIQYYGMFCSNSGTIKNLGVLQSTIRINKVISLLSQSGGIANLVGKNTGTIENVYYKDLRSTKDEEIGLAAWGGYNFAGLVYSNSGTVRNSYIAVSNIVNYTITDYNEIAEAIQKNTGTVQNVYFFDDSIQSCTATEIIYKNNLYDANTYTSAQPLVGIYAANKNALNTNFESITGWYVPNSYEFLSTYLTIAMDTPLPRGIDVSTSKLVLNGTEYTTYDASGKAALTSIVEGDAVEVSATLTIASTSDFIYMFELMNIDNHFAATAITYQITNDIDLVNIPSSAYAYKYVIGSKITGTATGSIKPHLLNGTTSLYPVIYNFDLLSADRKVVTAGVDAYGLFPYVSGEVSNLNIIPTTSSASFDLKNIDLSSSNYKAIGGACGYVEKGVINNVNTYLNVVHTQGDIGEFYLGGIVGLLGGEGELLNSTSAGSIDLSNVSITPKASSSFTGGIAVGGAVGYMTETYAGIEKVLSGVTVSVKPNANTSYMIGGVVGAGYTRDANELENLGSISVGTSSVTPTYNSLYVAGIIGRHLGVTKQVNSFTNQGTINVYTYPSATLSMVAGISNADILTTNIANTGLKASNQKSNAGVYEYWASSMANMALVNILNTGDLDSLNYTNGINVNSKNGFVSQLSGVYNLNYSYKYTGSSSKVQAALGTQTIDMAKVYEYAGVVNVLNGTTEAAKNYAVNLESVYNLQNFEFSVSQAVDKSSVVMIYTGVVKGSYINYKDVRNEGNMIFNATSNITAKLYKICGVFLEVSSNYMADTIYNGGDIRYNLSSTITGPMTISGIAYSNEAADASFYDDKNPFTSNYNKSAVGTLNNAINNGKIIAKDTSLTDDKTTNTDSSYQFKTGLHMSGVVSCNMSMISNTFNLGNVEGLIIDKSNIRLSVGGIVTYQIGRYARISNSANNGTIKAINFRGTNCYINAGGIAARNDKAPQGDTYADKTSSKQIIVFTINYGDVMAYSSKTTGAITPTQWSDAYAIASGILGTGLCNIVNVVNYGNIYGSQLAGGIIGFCPFQTFSGEVNSEANSVNIANCMNYARSFELLKMVSVEGNAKAIQFGEVYNLSSSRTTTDVYTETPSAVDNAYNGCIIAVIRYNNSTNAKYIKFRYLLSFSQTSEAFRVQVEVPSGTTGQTSTMYSTKPNQSYLNSSLVYTPLDSSSDAYGNIGVFSTDFSFRKAILGNSAYVDVDTYPTDVFLSDYFQFVSYSKINPIILDRIGWSTISYNNAAEEFAENLDQVVSLLNEYKTSNSKLNSIATSAFNTSTWIRNCNTDNLISVLTDILNAQDLATLKSLTNYVFLTSTNKSVITKNMREEFANVVITKMNNYSNLRDFLDAIMTTDIIAKIISSSDSNYDTIKNLIETDIDNLSNDDLETVAYLYYDVLTTANTYDYIFSGTYNEQYLNAISEMLEELLAGLNDSVYQSIQSELDSSAISTTYKYKLAVDSLTAAQKRTLYNNIINDLGSGTNSVVTTVRTALHDFLGVIDTSTYTETADTTVVNAFSNSITTNAEYVSLWNTIKNDTNVTNWLASYFAANNMYVKDANTGITHVGILDKATEYRNTYQTNDTPSNYVWTYDSSTGLSSTTQAVNSFGIGKFWTNQDYSGIDNLGSWNARPQMTRFIYTPDEWVTDGSTQYTYTYYYRDNNRFRTRNYSSTPKTYYYGPYLTSTVNSDYSGQMWNYTSTEGANAVGRNVTLNSGASGSVTMYVPFFMGLDESFVNSKIAETTFGSSTTVGVGTSWPYVWNTIGNTGQSTQWVSKDIMTTVPTDSVYLQKVDSVSPKNGSISTKYNFNYDLMPFLSYDQLSVMYYSNRNNNTYLTYVNTNNNDMDKSTLLYGYNTASIITGIYAMFDQWGNNGLFYTCKSDYNRYGVVTSQYIDYTINDLVNLDGVFTKGNRVSGNVTSDDEVAIIKRVVQLMQNNTVNGISGKSVIMTAIGDIVKNEINTSNNAFVQKYFNALANDTNYINALVGKIPYVSSSYPVTIDITAGGTRYRTIQNYLNYLYNQIDLTAIQEITANSLGSPSNFKKVVSYMLDPKYGYYSYIDSLSSGSNTYYQWFDNVYSGTGNYTSAQLASIISLIETNINVTYEDSDMSTMLTNNGYNGTNILATFKSYETFKTYYYKYISYYQWFEKSGVFSSNYSLSDLSLFITYLEANINSSSLATDIAGVNDADISTIVNAKLPDTYDASGRTAGDMTIGDNFYAVNYYDSYISGNYVTPVNAAITTNEVSGATINLAAGHTAFNVMAKGNGSITANGVTQNVTSTLTDYTFTLDYSTATTITVTPGVYLYVIGYDNDSNYSYSMNSLYNQIVAADITYATTNNVFSLTSNSVTNYLIEDVLSSQGVRYRLNVGNITSLTSGYSDAHFTITNAVSLTNSSATICGNTYSKALSVASSGSPLQITTTTAGNYLYLMGNTDDWLMITDPNGDVLYYQSNSNNGNNFYSIYLPTAGTYTIKSYDSTITIYDMYLVNKNITPTIGAQYLNFAAKGTQIINEFGTYSDFLKYRTRYNLFETVGVSSLTKKYASVIDLLYATKATDMALYLKMSDAQVAELFKKLYSNSDDYLRASVLDSSNTYITKEMLVTELMALCNTDSNFIYDIFSQLNLSSISGSSWSNYPWALKLMAAYVGTDFMNNLRSSSMTSSKMYTILEDVETHTGFTDTNYIDSDTSINGSKFQKLMIALGIDTSTSGYGIYALASSKGIQNGTFIPDNVMLPDLDAPYNRLANSTIITLSNEFEAVTLTEATYEVGKYYVNNSSVYELSYDAYSSTKTYYKVKNSSSWRDLTGSSTSSNYDVSNHNSVNYHVREEMKQLIKSISTTVFELDLAYTNAVTIYSAPSQIDLDNHIITYYVNTTYFTVLNSASRTSINLARYSVADSATFKTNANNTTSINISGKVLNGATVATSTTLTVADAFTVTAEDTTISAKYTIVFVKQTATNSMTIKSINGDTSAVQIPYNGGTVVIDVTTNLPDGADLSNYFYINTSNSNSNTYAEGVYWDYNTSAYNNCIVSGGKATITIDVYNNMPQGMKYFCLKYFTAAAVTCTANKVANTQAVITSFGYNGTDLTSTITGNSKSATSTVSFGRAFNYSELTDYTSDDFYLYKFGISSNATVVITATYSEISGGNGRIQYHVTYAVTSEDGNTTNTYHHYINESDYFTNGAVYGYLYKEGYEQTDSGVVGDSDYDDGIYKTEFKFGSETLSGDLSSLVYDNTQDNYVAVYFNRGEEPQYRIRYVLDNFYITSNNFTHNNNGSSIIDSYAGLTLTVTDSQDPNTYKFVYTYTNTGTWSGDVTYTRTYDFPAVYVVKDFSLDALLSRLTFLSESMTLSTTATVMLPTVPLIPSRVDGATYDAGVRVYSEVAALRNDIVINNTSIVYNNDSDAKSISDYYAIGTVSNSDLTYYSPTFGIDQYAQIYKYTTARKLADYGKATLTDKTVLEDRSTMYLYVPFEYTTTKGTNSETLLVELDSSGNWIKVWNQANKKTSDLSLVYTLDTPMSTAHATKLGISFTYNGYNYSLSSLAGSSSEENESLFMDYIGNPAEGHFWYVDYVVFSEYNLNKGYIEGNVRYYHISIIDATNTIYFDVSLYAIQSLDMSNIYLTIAENVYNSSNEIESLVTRQISAYAVEQYAYTPVELDSSTYSPDTYYILVDDVYVLSGDEFNSTMTYYQKGELSTNSSYLKAKSVTAQTFGNTTYYTYDQTTSTYTVASSYSQFETYYYKAPYYGMVEYKLKFNLQVLPKGYFYFYIDVPTGYEAYCVTDMENQLGVGTTAAIRALDAREVGSFLPYTSIITQTVKLDVMIKEGTDDNSSAWAVSTSDLYTKQIEYLSDGWEELYSD